MTTNIPYLLKILDTNKLLVLIEALEMSPLDLNLLLRDAEDAGEIRVEQKADAKKSKVIALKEPEITFDSDIAQKILRTVQHYNKEEINPTKTRILNLMKDPSTGKGYAMQDYLTSLQYLIDTDQLEEELITIPKGPKNPKQHFTFLQIPGNQNDLWNQKQVNKWVANWNSSK